MSVVVFPVVGPVFHVVGQSNSRGLVWAWLRCDLDVATASGARAELTGLLGGLDGPDVVAVYLGFERFVDLRGLRVLVEVAMSLRNRGGEMVLVAPPLSPDDRRTDGSRLRADARGDAVARHRVAETPRRAPDRPRWARQPPRMISASVT